MLVAGSSRELKLVRSVAGHDQPFDIRLETVAQGRLLLPSGTREVVLQQGWIAADDGAETSTPWTHAFDPRKLFAGAPPPPEVDPGDDEVAPLALQFERDLLQGLRDQDIEVFNVVMERLLARARLLGTP